MKILAKLVSGLLIWLIVTSILLAIILLPRNVTYERVGYDDVATYKFTWEAYQESITTYSKEVWDNKSFGTSKVGSPVEEEVYHYMKRTIVIIFPALIISLLLGILKGVFDYKNVNSRKNIIGNGTTWLMQSVPEYFIIITVQLGLLSLMSKGFPQLDIYGYDKWYNTLLPILFLSVYPISYIARITSSALSEQEGKDYIRTAIAKGTSSKKILYIHVLKNCYPTILSQFLTIMITLISSSIVVEYLTFYRGAGTRLIEALDIKTIYNITDNFPLEVPTIVGFTIGFMILILCSLWIHQLLNYILIPAKRGEE
ncbi:ABC transporter permease subunit [Bacillus sp. 31A1R]|uniref:ABC transporter permease subunit n=1 Tax=Robertmurraya mangrovi TaxID=3098077 RepID=A0ABU5IWK6_9BACI|nr:ABC transporter permease subunit [Bacillus sp. 31A1R]MDZ5471544.1 ABC transporter permease subunit [Bacillus sp. 31A1R]